MRGTELLRRESFNTYHCGSNAGLYRVCCKVENSRNGESQRNEARDDRSSKRGGDSLRESADGMHHVRRDSGWNDRRGNSNCGGNDSCSREHGDTDEGQRSSGLLLVYHNSHRRQQQQQQQFPLLVGGSEESPGEAVDAEGRSCSSTAFPLVRGVPQAACAALWTPCRSYHDCCEGQTSYSTGATGGNSSSSSNSSALSDVQYFSAMPQHGSPPAASFSMLDSTASSDVINKASPSQSEINARGDESLLSSRGEATTLSTFQGGPVSCSGAGGIAGAQSHQADVRDCRSGGICQWSPTGTQCSATSSAAAAVPRGVSAAAAVSSKEARGVPQKGQQPLAAGLSVDTPVSAVPATSSAVPAATSAVTPVSGLATPRAPACLSGQRKASCGAWNRQRISVSRISQMNADDSFDSRVRLGSSERQEWGSDGAESDAWTSLVRGANFYRDTRCNRPDMPIRATRDGTTASVVSSSESQDCGRKGRSLRVCWNRCVANLRKTWWPRLNRGIRIGAITTLALHLSVSKSLPGIGGIVGQDWCINTYSLASTVLPEQSGAVISGLWVWVFTLACIALLTFLLFPVLGAGATLGRMLCLLLFLLIVSWLSVMRLPLIYKVPPFDTDVNTHSLTSFAYLYIPYTTASVILSQQYRAFDTDLKTGLQYVVEMNTGVLLTSLLGWALFLLQVVLPPWSSQRYIVRMKLRNIMRDVAAAISDISESFVQLRRVLLSKKSQALGAREVDQGLFVDDLRAASHALQRSCQPLYTAIGSQTQLRVSIVASSTEPYLMYPGPAVFLFPFFARCCEVLIHNCMNVITLARHIDTLARDPLPVRLDTDAALANILLRTEPLLCTTMMAYQLCAELVSLRPDTLHRASFKARLRAGLEQLDYIDSQVSATFGLLRSPSMQEVSARQPPVGDDVSVCLQRLLSRVSVGSNMGASCPSEASAGYYPVSGVSATLERADYSLLRTWSQSGDLLSVRYGKGTDGNQAVSGGAVEGPRVSPGTSDCRPDGGAAARERQPQERSRVAFLFGGDPLSQRQQQEGASAAAATTATGEAAAAGSVRVGVLSPRWWLRYFGLPKHAPRTEATKHTADGYPQTVLPATGADAVTRDSRTAAAAAAGLEVPEVDTRQLDAYPAEDAPPLLPLGLAVSGSALSLAPSNADAASTAAAAAAGTTAATAGVAAPAGAAGTSAAAAGTGQAEAAAVTPGRVAAGATTAAPPVITRSRGWSWGQGSGSSLKLELHPIAEEPEQHQSKPAAIKTLEEKDEAGPQVVATPTKGIPTAQQTSKLFSAESVCSTAAASCGTSAATNHPGADLSHAADSNVRTVSRTSSGAPASYGRAASATGTATAEAEAASPPEPAAARGCRTPVEGFTSSSRLAAAQLTAARGEAFTGFLGSERTTSTIGAADATTGGNANEVFSSKDKEDSLCLLHCDLSSSPPTSSAAQLFPAPVHSRDFRHVPSNLADRPTLSHADVLASTTSLSPSSPLSVPAAAATPEAPHAVRHTPLPGAAPPLTDASQGRLGSPLRSAPLVLPASTGAGSLDGALGVGASLFVRVQTESASPPYAASTPRGGAVAAAFPTSAAASCHAPVADLRDISNYSSFCTVSPALGGAEGGVSSAVPSSDAAASAVGGYAPVAASPSPPTLSVVKPLISSGAASTSVSLLHSLASPAAVPVVTPDSTSNEIFLDQISFPLQRRLPSMDGCTFDLALAAGSTISSATSPAAASPAVDTHEPATQPRATAAANVTTSSGTALRGADAPPETPAAGGESDPAAGGGSSGAAASIGADGAAAGNEAPAVTRTSSSLSRTATAYVPGNALPRDEEVRAKGLRSGLLSLFSVERSKDTAAAQKLGSPLSRLSHVQHEEQEQGERQRLWSHLTQEERGLDAGGISTPSSSALSPSTPSAESSMSSIDMDAVLTNLLQQSKDREEAGSHSVDAVGAPNAAVRPVAGSDAPPATTASLHTPAASPPTTDGVGLVTGTSPKLTAAVSSAVGTALHSVAASTVAGTSADTGGTPAADVSPSVFPAPAAVSATLAVSADSTPAATTAAGGASRLAAHVVAAGLGGGTDGKNTKITTTSESPAGVRVSEDLRRRLSIPRLSLTRLASRQREDRKSSTAAAAATATLAGQERSTAEKILATEEENVMPPVRKHRRDKAAIGVPTRTTQPAAVESPSRPPCVGMGGSDDEKAFNSPVAQAKAKTADKKSSRVALLEAAGDVAAASVGGEEQRQLGESEEERPTPSIRGAAKCRGHGVERLAQKGRLLRRKKSDVFPRRERKWNRTTAPWTWLARHVPWTLVSAQRRQRQREEDLRALRALAQRSSREMAGFTACSFITGGRKQGSAVPADFSTTAELRQELRISKLVVSLYRICAMDTQELCSTVRGLCLAVVSPSWKGAQQNLKMMMLSLAMIFIQLFFGLRNLVRMDRWKWRGSEAFYRDVEAVHCMKLIFGLGFLFGCCLFYGPQIDRFLGGPLISGGPQTAKQWMILGFLCAHSFTYEGNTHKGLKRAVGTLLGGLAVELALMATSNYVLLLFLTFLSIAFVVFVFASPDEPSSEFDKEFGYIGQVFIWTVTFILNIIWIYEGLVPFPYLRDTVVRSRICGNVVGIGFSMMLTYVPPVFSAERAARTYCATLLKTCRRCILLMNAAFLSLTTTNEKRENMTEADVLESTNESVLSSSFLVGSPSPVTVINKPFHWARMWKFRRARPLTSKRRDWRWIHKDKEPQKNLKKAFHYYLQQAEQLLRHHSTRLLVVARMLYGEGASSEHSPVWRVDKDIGEIMNRVEYLVMSVVDAVDNLCQLAMGTDPDLAALLHGSAVLARESVLTLLQQDRRNWERVMRCRAGKALLINMVRMVKAQSVCAHLLAKEIQAAGLHALDRIINWGWFRFPATMPPKYIRAVLRYIQARSSIERYTNRVYESLAVCGRELREQGLFELDEWKGAIFSVLLIMEKCETRTYFLDEIHRFQLNSACRLVFANESPQLIHDLFGSSSVLRSVEAAREDKEEVCQRNWRARSALGKRSLVRGTRAHSYPLRGTAGIAADIFDESGMEGGRQTRHVSRRRSV